MAEASGPQWCARFPGSHSPEDLVEGFRGRVMAFISAMEKGGATVVVDATYRPPERAYLMHWCWMIANLSQSPAAVPHMAGVDIDWTHGGDILAARAAARAMVKGYDIEVKPALDSLHCHRRAIDMAIRWSGMLSIRDFDGNMHRVSSMPCDGTNRELGQVGASFGVYKRVNDPPHWDDVH